MVDFYVETMGDLYGAIRRALTPNDRFGPADPLIALWQRTLTVLGVIVVVTVSISFKGVDIGALGGVFDNKLGSMVPNAGLAMVAVVLGMCVLLIAAKPGERKRMLRSLGRPALALAEVGCAAVALQLFIMLTRTVMGYATAPRHWYLFFLAAGGGLVLWGLMLFVVLPLAVWIAWLCVGNWCNAADGHPVLPWLAAIVFAAETWALSIHSALTSGFGPPVPPILSACTTLGGPPVMLLLAGLAIHRLRNAGVSLRLVPTQPLSYPEKTKPGKIHQQWVRVKTLFS